MMKSSIVEKHRFNHPLSASMNRFLCKQTEVESPMHMCHDGTALLSLYFLRDQEKLQPVLWRGFTSPKGPICLLFQKGFFAIPNFFPVILSGENWWVEMTWWIAHPVVGWFGEMNDREDSPKISLDSENPKFTPGLKKNLKESGGCLRFFGILGMRCQHLAWFRVA